MRNITLRSARTFIELINNGHFDSRFAEMYGSANVAKQRERYIKALETFSAVYGDCTDVIVVSVPGRTELSGNHTDHNGGCVLAASVDLDAIAIAAPYGDGKVKLTSDGFGECTVDLNELTPNTADYGTSKSIIAGMCKAFERDGYKVGGYRAYVTSDVLSGSGLSSSAAFEVICGAIINTLFNEGAVSSEIIARYGQYAENVFFGKPCGLMDQTACAVGGILMIDFKGEAKITNISFDFRKYGYVICIVNTGGCHADLTADYAAVPYEMKKCAEYFGKERLCELTVDEVMNSATKLREYAGDRAVLRAIHFFDESERVKRQFEALKNGDVQSYLKEANASGSSSARYLQNIYSPSAPDTQSMTLALAILERNADASRVHGGGFAGTVQAYVKETELERFTKAVESVFGSGCCMNINVRSEGIIVL